MKQQLGTLMFRDIGTAYPAGTYRAEWDGTATLSWGFAAKLVEQGTMTNGKHYALLNVTPSVDGIYLKVADMNAADPLRNLHVWMPDYNGQSFAGKTWSPGSSVSPFHPLFLEKLAPFKTLRFMDWQETRPPPPRAPLSATPTARASAVRRPPTKSSMRCCAICRPRSNGCKITRRWRINTRRRSDERSVSWPTKADRTWTAEAGRTNPRSSRPATARACTTSTRSCSPGPRTKASKCSRTTTSRAGSISIADNDVAPRYGLDGAYYDNKDFTAYKFTRLDPQINFNWGTGAPDSRIAKDTFSIRWKGTLAAVEAGNYTLSKIG